MQKTFITIENAIQITGRSESTIRRIVREIKSMPNSEDYLTKEPGKTKDRHLIDKDYLFKKLGMNSSEPPREPASEHQKEIKRLKEEIKKLQTDLQHERKMHTETHKALNKAQDNLNQQQKLLAIEQKLRLESK